MTDREEGIAMLRNLLELLEADPTMTAIVDVKAKSSQMEAGEGGSMEYATRDTTIHLEIL